MSDAAQSKHERMETIWLERARRLSQRVVLDESGEKSFPVLALGVEDERYGIDLCDVAEVLPPIQATPVPGASPVFSGVINVHGEIRPVLNLRRLLGMEGVLRHSDPTRMIVPRTILLRKEGREMGLQIDSVEQIRWIGPGNLQPAGNGGPALAPHFKGLTQDLLMLLSTNALFAELEKGVTT